MTITGRLTKDAVLNSLSDEKKVTNFSLAINDSFKPKGKERIKVTTFCNCAYWQNEKLSSILKKGVLVEVTGRIYVTAYVGADGGARASLNCHVNSIKILAYPREVEVIGSAIGGTNNDTSNR